MKKIPLLLFTLLLVFSGCVKIDKKRTEVKGQDGVLYAQSSVLYGSVPYINNVVSFSLPSKNTDGSDILDLGAVNIYYSFDGEDSFVKGESGPNFLTKIPIEGLPPYSFEIKEMVRWIGLFNDREVWVRATALDIYGNESDFSSVAVTSLSNLGTERPRIIRFDLNSNGLQILLEKSNGQEVVEVTRDLTTGTWDEVLPIKLYYTPEEVNVILSTGFFRIRR